MFLTRLLTAVALLAAFFAALWCLDRRGFSLVAALVVAAGGYEWAALRKYEGARAAAFGVLCALLALSLLQVPAAIPWICAAAAAFWMLAVPWWLRRPAGLPEAGSALLGLIVLVPAALAMASLSRERLLMALGLVWIADTAAYLAGRAFGRHKLAPGISPGKTWEGVAGAVLAVAAYAIICAVFDDALAARVKGAAWLPFLAAAGLLCAVSVVGDLFESAVKRRAGVKDSGRLLPGHGGVLDRIDSATAVLPLAYLLFALGGAG